MAIKEIKREWSPEQLDYVKHYLLHTESDVKDLPKCCIGSRATVGETDHEYVCAECGWVRADFVELAAICPDLLTDPDVEIGYYPGVTEIAAQQFWKDASVPAVLYYPDVTKIGQVAFADNTAIRAAVFPKLVETAKSDSDIFRAQSNMTVAHFPALKVMNSKGMFSKTGLTHATFPELESIGGYGSEFTQCASLQRVDMPKLKTVASGGTFESCTSLVKVNCPELELIPPSFLRSCSALKRFDARKAASIATQAFRLSSLETLILRNETVCTLANVNAFQNTPIASGTGYIYVPSALIEDYKVATNWSTYAAQFRAIEDYPDVCATDLDEPITKGEAIELVNEKMASAGGSGGAFVVNVTGNSTDGYTADKTFAEIDAAYQVGTAIQCRDNVTGEGKYMNLQLSSAYIGSLYIFFSLQYIEASTQFLYRQFKIASDGTITFKSDTFAAT